jgi:hypothetical protein
VVRVTGVRATLEPYNPALTDHGLPAEQVTFSVRGATTFSCRVAVHHDGHVVGTTTVGFGPPSHRSSVQNESVPVGITGATFAGTTSSATVTCQGL